MGIAFIVLLGLLAMSVRTSSQQKSTPGAEPQKKEDEERDVVDEIKTSTEA
jgi:hypothetical protein